MSQYSILIPKAFGTILMSKFKTYCLSAIIILAASFLVLAVIPINSGPLSFNDIYLLEFRLDYLLHGLLFFPWMWILLFIGIKAGHRVRLKEYGAWFFIGLVLCVLTEAVQLFTPYRTFNVNDLVGNVIGLSLGLVLLIIFLAFVKRGVSEK
ncbi:MAG: VanZ family protein [Bacteroidetes bacterium]|nr:VanZ family protein [Bacteroidota bacterium]